MVWLNKTLLDTCQPIGRYVLAAVALSMLPATAISMVVNLFFRPAESVSFNYDLWQGLSLLVIVAPVTETLLMWPVIKLISRATSSRDILTAAISALAWGAFHSLTVSGWGFSTGWSFFVFSLCFIAWRKVSLLKGLLVTAGVHATQNLLAYLYMFYVAAPAA